MRREDWAARLTQPLSPLRTLMVAYFNEDWEADFHTWQDAAAAFARDEPTSIVDPAVADLNQLIQSDLDEDDLLWLLEAMASGVRPEGLGLHNRQWLCQLQEELRRIATA